MLQTNKRFKLLIVEDNTNSNYRRAFKQNNIPPESFDIIFWPFTDNSFLTKAEINLSLIGNIFTCSGASHVGNLPA